MFILVPIYDGLIKINTITQNDIFFSIFDIYIIKRVIEMYKKKICLRMTQILRLKLLYKRVSTPLQFI